VTETVNVTGEAPLLQTTAATLGKVFDSRMVVDLPLVTRNYTQLLSLQAGVVGDIPDAAGLGSGTQGFSVAGGRYYDNSVSINAVNAQSAFPDAALGGPAIVSPDSVEEFKVQTNLYSAEYGRAGGASVDLVTKTGTNQFHGDVFEFFRNNALNANDFFYKAAQMESGEGNHAPELRQNQFGGTIGGPIRKDKTFFFFSYQGTRQINGVAGAFTDPVYPLLPPGDRSNTGSFQAELGAIYGGRTGFPIGICAINVNCILPDGSNINPVALKILQAKLPNGQYMLPSFPQSSFNDGQGGLNGGQVFSNASFSMPSDFDEDQYTIDIDHQISSRQRFSAKWFSAGDYVHTPVSTTPGFWWGENPVNRNLTLSHTFAVSPTLVNEFRAGYVRIAGPIKRQDAINDAEIGMTHPPDSGAFPELEIATAGINMAAAFTYGADVENTYSLSDTLAKTWGSHSFRFGGTFERHQPNYDADIAKNGAIIMYGFSDFLLGQDAAGNNLGAIGLPISNLLASIAATGSTEKEFRFSDLSYFIQDDYKVRRNLTLNFGMRWDYFAWPTEKEGRLGNFDAGRLAEGLYGTPPAGGTYSGYTIAEQFHRLNPGFPIPPGVAVVNNSGLDGEDYRNYGPRLGFAWSPFQRLAVRGGYGIFYPRVNTEAARTESEAAPFFQEGLASFDPNGTLQDPFTFLNLPKDSAFPIWQPRQYIPGQTATMSILPMDPAMRNPYVQQWNFSLQYSLSPNTLLEVAYEGSHGVRLMNTMAGNQPGIASAADPIRGVTTNTNGAANIQARSPIAGVVSDRGDSLSQTTAASKYDALLVTVNKRMSHGLQFLSAFTYGKSTDTNTISQTGQVGNEQPPGNNIYNNHWGLSDFDRKARSTTSLIYELPNLMKNQRGFLNKGFGGWQAATVMTFQSGNPLTIEVMPTYSAVKLQGYLTPDLLPGKTLADVQGHGPIEKRLNDYFNSTGLDPTTGATLAGSDFVLPGPLDYGGLGRGLPLRAPGEKSVDFVLSKRTIIHEKTNLEFRAEFFNFFNWVNFGGPDSSVSDAAFGEISSTTVAPRIIQFALKLNF
jgi:hypothetical protein